jgi:hypothetical protein
MIPSFTHGLNVLAVLVSGAWSLVLGFLWYGPLFAKAWSGYTGWTGEKVKALGGGRMALSYVLTFIAAVAQAVVLSVFARSLGITTWDNGLWMGALAGLAFTALGFGTSFLFEHRPFGLWLIVSGYEVIYLAGAGVLVSVWA